ncbi:hypothetical protein QFW77_11540 [Luteimonas sp. RD2P54]|uniref:Uncharacterized protein n=1 Tax=Luteimonas endophytica TaxID=3042023 RepID=A0ABT6J9X3_9GAMM|nr:hypothetical protein [Luteimonas endophytica]MDH5823620.1 hypothetical protein [Luteimonas endophytica]
MHLPIATLLIAVAAAAASPLAHGNGGAGTQACTFAALSAEDQRRYQSRYRRRVRLDGVAAAEQWIHEQACMTAEQRRAARKPPTGKDGEPCTRTRMEMRVTPGFDGAMTMTPVTACAD